MRLGFYLKLLLILSVFSTAQQTGNLIGITHDHFNAPSFVVFDPISGIEFGPPILVHVREFQNATIQSANGLARHPVTHELYAVIGIQGRQARSIVRVTNYATGECSFVTDTIPTATIAFGGEGNLYTIGGGQYPEGAHSLLALDIRSGAATYVTPLMIGTDGETLIYSTEERVFFRIRGGQLGFNGEILEVIDPTDVSSRKLIRFPQNFGLPTTGGDDIRIEPIGLTMMPYPTQADPLHFFLHTCAVGAHGDQDQCKVSIFDPQNTHTALNFAEVLYRFKGLAPF